MLLHCLSLCTQLGTQLQPHTADGNKAVKAEVFHAAAEACSCAKQREAYLYVTLSVFTHR